MELIRARLAGARGRNFWRSLEELAGTGEFQEFLHREFPRHAAGSEGLSRRDFLKFMGASLALAGLGGCAPQPDEKIVPYVRAPEQLVPGKPLYFATGYSLGGWVRGCIVESHEGRPTKIEGNPAHPASLGATDAFTQASILSLYDPDRSQVILRGGRIATWSAFLSALNAELETQRVKRGAGLRLLTETVTSPTLAGQIGAILKKFPAAMWHQFEPVGRENVRRGARMAFGENVHTLYRFDQADVIVSLESDFLSWGSGSIRYARDFVNRRRVREGRSKMNRLYVIESTPSLTGAMADHRLPVRSGEIEHFLLSLARRLGLRVRAEGSIPPEQERWIEAIAKDLRSRSGRSLVLAGDSQPASAHALAHAINHDLGSIGKTVIHTSPVEAVPVDEIDSLGALLDEMEAGGVELLLILGGNPVFTAPADFNFAERLARVNFRVHLSLYEDETSALCHWHIPEAHSLESWSDGRAYEGTVTILQPLIAPLYGGRSAHELLAALTGEIGRSSHDIVRDFWRERSGARDFDRFWRRSLHDGFVAGTALPPKSVQLRAVSSFATGVSRSKDPKPETKNPTTHALNSLELVFRPDPTIWDGRFANNAWLQELPKPLSKLTWDNAALVDPATAARLGLASEDMAELDFQGRKIRAPVWIMPGQAPGSIALHLGYGRERAGRVGDGLGINSYRIRTSGALWFGTGLRLRKLEERYPLASTQHHQSLEGRHHLRVGKLEDFLAHPEFVRARAHEPEAGETLYRGFDYDGNAWGMVIDLNACIGCNACVAACQAENNIPTVGKQEVIRGREMHWLRIDRYYEGGLDNPLAYHQPVPCMHCENAPCEPVCPVGATVHSSEGLNDMIYNRCVGTRYCSNNCPYKVRRFNFFAYADWQTPSLKLLRNPDVTARGRGVMEKCTYCVQRINAARIEAKKEDRKIRDGEIQTACQQVCPAQAIAFGNLSDPKSQVATLKKEPLNYAMLGELNTRPRTTYLGRLRNPNPELEK